MRTGKLSFILSLLLLLIFDQTHAQTTFAVIGDFGSNSSNERAVSNLVNSWGVDFVLTVGDNIYGSTNYQTHVGDYYDNFITHNFSTTRFFPSLGNHDYSDGGGSCVCTDNYFNYFTELGGKENYDFVKDNIHFFVINSITNTTAQEVWLQTQMTNCQQNHNHWEIVYFHHPPYSSGNHGSTTRMRWAFKDWGADAVLSGHDHTYERLEVNGLTYFVNGLGGKSIYSFGNALSETQFRYNGDYGAQKVTVSGNEMTFEFYNTNGDLIDSRTIQQSSPDITPPQLQTAAILNPTQVVLSFSESLESQSAQNAANYSIYNGIGVLSSALSSNNRDVTLTTTEHSPNQQYTVAVTNVTDLAGNVISSQANSAQYFLEVDTTPPQLLSATINNPTQVVLGFSESLDPPSAQNMSNYNINNGISVVNAVLNSNNTDVTLTTSAHTTDITYTAIVSNVTDLSGNVISSNNNSADYQLIISSGPIFPVDLFGTAEAEKTVNVNLPLSGNIPDILTYHLIAFDADHGGSDPPEGHAFINGNGPLELFPGATQANGDRQTNSFEFPLPSSWWVNGLNELRFVRLYSTGYRIDSAFVSLEGSTDVLVEDNIPKDFALDQNYPNPFNPTTNISFSLPENSRVRITVYNLLGELVAEPVNSYFVSGNHTISFDASEFTSGLYFYKMEAGGFIAIKKMTLIK